MIAPATAGGFRTNGGKELSGHRVPCFVRKVFGRLGGISRVNGDGYASMVSSCFRFLASPRFKDARQMAEARRYSQ